MSGKTLALFAEFQESIQKGKSALFIGPNYVTMSHDKFLELSQASTQGSYVAMAPMNIIFSNEPEPDPHQPKLFTEEEIESCNQPTK
jgi:hypothetical protein